MKRSLIPILTSFALLSLGCGEETPQNTEPPQPALIDPAQTAEPPAATDFTVVPNTGVAGHFGTWTVSYEIDQQGMDTGGAIRVQLPDAWHAGLRNSAFRLQATEPAADHFVRARSSNPKVRLQTTVEDQVDMWLVKRQKRGLDGRAERYVYVVRVEVEEGRLIQGDRIEVIYGDTSQGSRGMQAGVISTGAEPVFMAIRRSEGGEFERLTAEPTMTIKSGPPEYFYVTGPSTLVRNEPARLQLSVVDLHFNPVPDFAGPVAFKIVQGDVTLPDTMLLDFQSGWDSIVFTPESEGVIRIQASARDELFKALSNPMQVFAVEPEQQIYWGDLHSHSRYSHDGVGRDPFTYARYVTRLDFYAMTDHHLLPYEGYTRGLSESDWLAYTAQTDRHNTPGHFATLHAYEASFGKPFGHHNVYFRGEPGAFLAPGQVTLPELWEELEAGKALTIPHHTGKFPEPITWDHHDPDFRRNFEIYSGPRAQRGLRPRSSARVRAKRFHQRQRLGPRPLVRAGCMDERAGNEHHRLLGRPSGSARQTALRSGGGAGL